MAGFWAIFAVFGIALGLVENCHGAQYFGKLIGKLSELHHGVSGEVYAVDARTLYIKDFTYDGQGPAAYFYASVHKAADKNGFRLRDETGSGEVIRRYRKEGLTLTLPEGKTIHSIKIFYLWCEEFDVNFGDVKIPRSFDYPRPQKIESIKGVHSISSDNIVIVDAQTLLIPNLSYDGEAPDAKFWVGRGPKPSPQGIRVPDENGKEVPLRRYDRKTVVLTLPGDLTVFDIGHFGIWCEMFTVDFGHVTIPQQLNIPPSLKMLGVSPQSKLNCEVLFDDLAFEVRWAVAGESIVLQLVAKLENGEYMSFGLSGDDSKTVMIGGDVVVAWVDKQTLKGYAEDYYLEDKSQCSGPTGSCPDNRLSENSNNVRLLNAAMVNGYSIVTYQRPLKASDQFDRPIITNHSQAIIWAIGPLNQRNEVSFHSRYLKNNHLIEFGRPARWNCPMPEIEQPTMTAVYAATSARTTTTSKEEEYYDEPTTSAPKRTNVRRRQPNRGASRPSSQESAEDSVPIPTKTKEQTQPSRRRGPQPSKESEINQKRNQSSSRKTDAWVIPPIECDEPEDGVFYAQMGPTGGKRGYPAITGHVGWGISWYINGLLIPEIHVVRGKSYNFVVEGGDDPEIPARYHPFYITDDPVGGYAYKTAEERKNIRIYAGARKDKDGSVIPTGTGRLCTWTQTGELEADDYASFGAYQRVLELKCDRDETPGIVQWTPDRNTPDTVYYQCFTHRFLGWKIHVHDSCDRIPAASELRPVVITAPKGILEKSDVDLEETPSTRVETRVKQNNIFKEDNEDKDSKSIISEKVEDQPTEQLPNLNLTLPTNSFTPIHHVRIRPALYSYHLQQTQPNLHNFKPSTLLNVGLDSTKIQPTLQYYVTTTTISSSAIPTSTTERPTTTPKFNDNIAVASDTRNQTFLIPPPIQYRENIIYRRPVNYVTVPIKVVPQNHLGLRYYGLPVTPYKKPIIRMPNYRPYKHKMYAKGSPYILLQPTPVITKSPIESQIKVYPEKPRNEQVKHIEISPQQASTEREPEIQTAPSTSIADIVPSFLRPAFNTGFKPGSIKIESGFKPIITKDFQDRVDKEEPVVEYESEKGVIQVNNTENFETKPIQVFEPMFIPSPPIKPTKEKRVKVNKGPVSKKGYQYMKIVVKRPRSLQEDFSDPDEPIAEAAERFDSYYLPPTNAKPVEVVRQPSNIDLDLPDANPMLGTPPDVVITYDGKKLSGQSLTANLNDRPSVITQRLSKASAYITARPQFGRFKGELPPLNIDFVSKNAPQLQSSAGVLNRELDTPLPSENEQRVASTRLSRVKSYGNESK